MPIRSAVFSLKDPIEGRQQNTESREQPERRSKQSEGDESLHTLVALFVGNGLSIRSRQFPPFCSSERREPRVFPERPTKCRVLINGRDRNRRVELSGTSQP